MSLSTQELRELLELIDEKLEPIRNCINDIDTGMESDVDDHYDCASDLRELASTIALNAGDDRHFDAVIAKNQIARDIRDNPNHISVSNLMFQLEEIEKYTGTLNQPSIKDILESEYML